MQRVIARRCSLRCFLAVPGAAVPHLTRWDCCRPQSIGGYGKGQPIVEGEVRMRYTSQHAFTRLNVKTMPHYVRSKIQQERREVGLPEVDDWDKFAETAMFIRNRSGGFWIGNDDPRAARKMRRKEKHAENPMQLARQEPGPDPAVTLEGHALRRYFTTPTDFNDPLSVAEGVWRVGRIKEVDVKHTATKIKWVERPPVVTIMGHVDHGKTTLLDYLRNTNVAAEEVGGITQSIGAFRVKCGSNHVTFVDTPGHAAFGEMRKAGATCTDIIVLVVSVTDGVQNQTHEVIKLAEETGIPLIVAINKIDRGDKIQRVLSQLREAGISFDTEGGDTMSVKISALKGTGIQELLEAIELVAAMCELQTPKPSRCEINVIDSHYSTEVQRVAGIVRCGVLKPGMTFVSGLTYATVDGLFDETGRRRIDSADVCSPVLIEGFKTLPKPGVTLMQVASLSYAENFHKLMREVYKTEGGRESYLQSLAMDSRNQLYQRKPDRENLQFYKHVPYNLVVKAASFGQLQALMSLIYELPYIEGVHLKLQLSSVGGLIDRDLMRFVGTEKGCILVFGCVKNMLHLSVPDYIDEFQFDVIYHGIEWLKQRIVEQLPKITREVVVASAVCKDVFRASAAGFGNAGGAYVTKGAINAQALNCRVLRQRMGSEEREVAYNGRIKQLRRFKEQVPTVESGLECGIILFDDFSWRAGDILEVFDVVEEDHDVEEVFAAAAMRDAKAALERQLAAENEPQQNAESFSPSREWDVKSVELNTMAR